MAVVRRSWTRGEWVSTAVVAAAAFSAVLFYRLEAGQGYPLDDSWIHLAYARNIAMGHGFGITPGDPTPGATSPLWILLLAPGFLFGRVHEVWPWVLGAITLAGAGVAAMRLVRLWGDGDFRWPSLACGLCVVLCGPLVWSAAGAMEVPLFSLLVLMTLTVFSVPGVAPVRSGARWGVFAGLAALARPEGLLLIPLGAALSLLRRPSPRLSEALAGAGAGQVVYAPSVIFCLATNGRIFPNTFYAKTTALVAGAPDAGFLAAALRLFLSLSPVAVVAFTAALVAAFVVRGLPAGAWYALAFTVALPVAYATMGRTFLFANLAGNFGRYLYPALPTALVAGWWGIAALRRRAGPLLPGWILPALIALAVVFSAAGTRSRAALYAHNVRDINSMQVAIAHRLSRMLPAGALVAANDVGALAYFCDFRVLDLIGIVSAVALEKLETAGQDRGARDLAVFELLNEQRPAALVVFPEWYRGTLIRLREKLVPITEALNNENITSGGSRLVAYAIDWN